MHARSWFHTQQFHSVCHSSAVSQRAILCRSAWIVDRCYRTAAVSGEKVRFRSTALSGRWTVLWAQVLTSDCWGRMSRLKRLYLLLLAINGFFHGSVGEKDGFPWHSFHSCSCNRTVPGDTGQRYWEEKTLSGCNGGHNYCFLALPLGSKVPLISEIFAIAGVSSLLVFAQTKRGFIPVSTLRAEQKD